MTRLVLRSAIFRNILIVACCVLTFMFVQVPVALAQHGGGGHVGGGHVGGGGIGGGVHAAPPPAGHGAGGSPHFTPAPPIGHFGAMPGTGGAWRFRGPVRPLPPPFYPFYGYPFFFGGPFFYGFWPGFGFSSCWWWANCDLFWLWGFGFNNWGPYGSGYGSGGEYTPETYAAPAPTTPTYAYPFGGGSEALPQLYLKDGTVYTVMDYWLVDDELHFTMREEGKNVEHTIPFEDLDLQQTVDVAKRRGFLFVLRDEPLEQYMKNHPDTVPAPEN
jgi:hypothetical protein